MRNCWSRCARAGTPASPSPGSRCTTCPTSSYFSHEIHVNKGIGCESCHGRVDEMPLMYEQNTLQMEWCLDCHRNPAKNLRPTSEIYNMAWEAERR
jgi:NAD-dependent SIR2 family protein deacetylase